MTDYREWCDFCGEMYLGRCYCKAATKQHNKWVKEYEKGKKIERERLSKVKEYLVKMGFDPGLKQAYDHDSCTWVPESRLTEWWINSEKYTRISVDDVAKFVEQLVKDTK